MDDKVEVLRERLSQLENLALEHQQLKSLLHHAEQGHSINQYGRECVVFIDPTTERIVDAGNETRELLGYSKEELIGLYIHDLDIAAENSTSARQIYVETSIEEHIFSACFKHRLGHQVTAKVYSRLLDKPNGKVLYMRLEDTSLHQQLWRELQRRDDSGFIFQQKLKILNEITNELSSISSFDTLCQRAIELGISRLGFDRLGLWFYDAEHHQMVGTYGVDEQGNVRAEHNQRWFFFDTYIMEFLAGKTDAAFAYNDAPIYNDKSEIIEFGWHISAPMLHGDRFVGVLTTDNYINKGLMKNYEPELLRLYGITIGHLTELAKTREQAFEIRLQQERHRMLKQFITEVGHDFRTPLSVINTNCFLIQRVPEVERRQALAAVIQEQVTYMSGMLDDMGSYMALEDLRLTFHATDLYKMMTEIISAHEQAGIGRSIQYEIAPEETFVAPADAQYLREALNRIFENALEFTAQGGWVRVSFAVYPTEIGVRISDNGIGIEKDALEAIFNPLFRVDKARTERRNGLGLSIAKSIIEAHHGRILVESEPGKGSIFEVILPRV